MKLPRFTLRDLFWLVLVCALAVGWWVERSRLTAQIDGLDKLHELKLKQACIDLENELQAHKTELAVEQAARRPFIRAKPTKPEWGESPP